MTVYVVGYTTAYEGGDLLAVYSSREKAEASWRMRNADAGDLWEITEFGLDLDPDAEKPDIDRRPRHGPKTFGEYTVDCMWDSMCLANLRSPEPPPRHATGMELPAIYSVQKMDKNKS